MPSVAELGARLNVPVEELVRMGEMQVRNPASAIFRAIEAKVGAKFAALKASEETVAGKKGKPRVYIPHAVPATRRFNLVMWFPQFDIRFTGVDKRAAAVALATYTLTVEYMLSQIRVTRGRVLAYGVSVKQVVMRNRDWIHICIPAHNADVQVEVLRDDRAIMAMVGSFKRIGHEPGLAKKYAAGEADITCTDPNRCEVTALAGVADLSRTDTNFRQLAFYMQRHKLKLLYFCIPGNKDMEMGTEGPFNELDAYVFPSDGGARINISYKNAPALDMSFTYSNYLELVARTTVVLSGVTYHKEFFNRIGGVLTYKITAIEKTFEETFAPYRSWIEPDYKSKYMVYAPVLRPGGSLTCKDDVTLVGAPVDRNVIDTVTEHAMRIQGAKNLALEIERKLFAFTSNYALSDQIVTNVGSTKLSLFEFICLAIYCNVFVRKYKDGATVSTLAPQARDIAYLARASGAELVPVYIGAVLGGLVRKAGVVSSWVRDIYYKTVAMDGLPMPSLAVCPGYVEYSDTESSNPLFVGWFNTHDDPTFGFTSMLPGVSATIPPRVDDSEVIELNSETEVDIGALIATGHGYIDNGKLIVSEHASILNVACGAFGSVMSLLNDCGDALAIDYTDEATRKSQVAAVEFTGDIIAEREMLYTEEAQRKRKTVDTEGVHVVVDKIINSHGMIRGSCTIPYTENVPLFDPGIPEMREGPTTCDPRLYLMEGIRSIFPTSLIMNTSQFASDLRHGSWEVVVKAIRMKLDLSKLNAGKPESVYLPLMRGHVQPNAKNEFNTTFHAVVKRNANTPVDADLLDENYLWDCAIKSYFRVFCVPDAEEKLKNMPYVGPNEESVHEWVSGLDDRRRARLVADEDGFSFPALLGGAAHTHMMIKGKMKPSLDAAYETSVKLPQSIQYDPTGKTVAVFSPMIAQKVDREQSILLPNILVLQRKSRDDIIRFLNTFDWRPNERGERYYIEIDYTMYDKSQGRALASMYLRKCALFGVLKDYLTFVQEHQHSRTVSALKAGVKGWLQYQNQSGAAFTLDRNNDINLLVTGEFIERILSRLEFVIVMGDDILIAVRGLPDISTWESDINRKYGLTLKADIHKHGYICSLDIVHLPDGHSTVVADIIKRALMYMDQSIVDEEKFAERFISYKDSMKGVQDPRVQRYLSHALPERMQSYLPGVTPDAVLSICRAHSAFCSDDGDLHRSMFALLPTVRYD